MSCLRGDSDDYNLTAGARVFKGKMEADRMAIEALESKLTNIYMKPVEEQTYIYMGWELQEAQKKAEATHKACNEYCRTHGYIALRN